MKMRSVCVETQYAAQKQQVLEVRRFATWEMTEQICLRLLAGET